MNDTTTSAPAGATDTSKRTKAKELGGEARAKAREGAEEAASRAESLDVLGGHNNPPTAALEPDLAPGPP